MCSVDGCQSRARGRGMCAKHYQAAWKRGQFEGVPVPVKPGTFVCPPEHKHGGSGVCYTMHHCRCDECRRVRSETDRRRAKLHAYGRWVDPYVSADVVREHLAYLQQSGMGYKTIAHAAGVSVTGIRSLIYGRQDPGPRYGEMPKRLLREKAVKLLAVRPAIENLAGGAKISSRGVHRRIQALVAIGWSQSKLAERIGMNPTNMGAMLQRPQVMASTHRAVAAVYEELWNKPPAHSVWREKIAYARSLSYARKHGWLPPMAWDDIDNDVTPPTVDDVPAVDEVALELAIAGERVKLSPAELRAGVVRLHESRWSDSRIAERLGCAQRTVLRIRQELGLESFTAEGIESRRIA